MSDTFQVPVVKAKGETIEVDSSALPDASYKGVFAAGLKVCINTGTTKITKDHFTDAKGVYDEAGHKAAALAKAQEKVAELIAGTYKFGRGTTAAKGDHKLTVIATRLARDIIKQLIKDSDRRVTSFKASQITAAAKEFLATDEASVVWARAKDELENVKSPAKFKLSISEDPELVRKNAEKAKAEKLDLGQLSAAKSAKVKTRAMSGVAHLN